MKVACIVLAILVLVATASIGLAAEAQSQERQVALKQLASDIKGGSMDLGKGLDDSAPNNDSLRVLVTTLWQAYSDAGDKVHATADYYLALEDIYHRAIAAESYRGVLLATITKQMMLDAIWREMHATWPLMQADESRLDQFDELLTRIELPAESLEVFVVQDNDVEKAAAEDESNANPQIRDIWKRIRESNKSPDVMELFLNTVEEVGGYENLTTERLLFDQRHVLAAKVVMETEARCRVNTRGAIEFLRRGGDPRKINAQDVRPLHNVIPLKETFEFTYALSEWRHLTVFHLVELFEHDRDATVELSPGTSVPKSWAGLIFSPRE